METRKQKQVWEKEHASAETLPALATEEPSDAVTAFVGWLKKRDLAPSLKAIDIGCGKGRNSVYLAKNGFEVYGMDYIKAAIDLANTRAAKAGVSSQVKLHLTEIDKPWPFENDFFDVAIDYFASVDIENKGWQGYLPKGNVQDIKAWWACVCSCKLCKR